MIFGIGTDIVNVTRLENSNEFLERFVKRSMTEDEQQAMGLRHLTDLQSRALYIAKRFAAKEAVVKAMGTGFQDGIYLSDIEVLHERSGRPIVKLHGAALKYVQTVVGKHAAVHISLSDDYPFATAVAVIEAC